MEINNVRIHDFERLDDLQRKGYHIIQNPKRFCFGIDAVLLSDFAKVKKGDVVLDLGTGTGIIPMLICAKSDPNYIIGIDIQIESVEMATRSVKLNCLDNKIKIKYGNIKNVSKIIKNETIDCITINPPYINKNGGIVNSYEPKAIARHELYCNLEDIIRESAKVLKFKGRFYMIHRPHRLGDIISLMRMYNLEIKTLRFIYPYIDREATMVLIESIKGSKAMLRVLPPLINYNSDGSYTDEINRIYYG